MSEHVPNLCFVNHFLQVSFLLFQVCQSLKQLDLLNSQLHDIIHESDCSASVLGLVDSIQNILECIFATLELLAEFRYNVVIHFVRWRLIFQPYLITLQVRLLLLILAFEAFEMMLKF